MICLYINLLLPDLWHFVTLDSKSCLTLLMPLYNTFIRWSV